MREKGFVRVSLTRILSVKKIIACFTAINPPHLRSRIESHNFWELVYLRHGRVEYQDGDKVGVLLPGEAVLHAPNVKHGIFGDGKHHWDFFIISFECDSPAMAALESQRIRLSPQLQALIEAIIAERDETFVRVQGWSNPLRPQEGAPVGGRQMIALYLEQLLISLIREMEKERKMLFSSKGELDACLCDNICSYLEQHLHDDVSIEQLCRHFHYGKSYLCAAFRRVKGDSVMHWYHVRKLEEAKRLLLESDQSIQEIAAALHYDSPQYFSRVFTKHTGVCPRDFRTAKA